MPNHITNKLSVKALLPSEVQEVFDFIKGDDEYEFIDFNKIVPMPEDVRNSDSTYNGSMPLWYTWSCENWGTKWNAYDADIQDNVLTFNTAWSDVSVLIQKLADKFKKVAFLYEYADEDTGCNCGKYLFLLGDVQEQIFENQSKEAYEHCFKLNPDVEEYYELVDGEYEYIE